MRRLIKTVLQSLRKSGPAEAPRQAEGLVAAPPAPDWVPGLPPAGPPGEAVYWPEIFEATSLSSAKGIALTPGEEMSTEDRWVRETAFTLEMIASRMELNERHRVFDFGCGAGRMSRALIERFGCSVVGVDMAAGMREQASAYVNSPRFTVLSPEQFDASLGQGYTADFGLACWSLQHCMYPAVQVSRVANGLAMEAPFLLINSLLRLIPTNLGWRSDGEDLDALMGGRFDEVERLNFSPDAATADLISSSSIVWWRRRV